MAQPKGNLTKWELRKLAELNITHWQNDDDAQTKMRAAIAAKMKDSNKGGGFGAIDARADEKKAVADKKDVAVADKKDEKKAEPAVQKVEVLPATQTVDVTAPTINVHVPAPGVTITGDQFKWYPVAKATFNWMQAAVIGAAFYAALSSRLGDALITLTMK